jgi:arylformamidase
LRARWPGWLDLAYGSTPRQAIDLFLPRGAAAASLLVFIHGGYWQSRDRKDFSFVAAPWLERGVAVALLGYDLAPEVRMDAIVAEVRAGLAWLCSQARRSAATPRGCISPAIPRAGISRPWPWPPAGLRSSLPDDEIKGVCAISGVFDLEPIRLCYLNEVVGLDAHEARATAAPSAAHPLPHVAVGELETRAFHEQSRAFATRLEREGWPCQLLVQPEVDHFAIVMSMADADAPVVQAMAHQMGLGGAPT